MRDLTRSDMNQFSPGKIAAKYTAASAGFNHAPAGLRLEPDIKKTTYEMTKPDVV